MKSILVVDSSTGHAFRVADALVAAGFHTLVRHDTTDLLDLVKRYHPDAILLDELMPTLEGLNALRALSRDPATRHIPFVMLATRPRAAEKVRALWQGARDYLIKPVDPQRLVRLINALITDGVSEPVGAPRQPGQVGSPYGVVAR